EAGEIAKNPNEATPIPAPQPATKVKPVVKANSDANSTPLITLDNLKSSLKVVTDSQEFKFRANEPLFNLMKTKNPTEFIVSSLKFQLWNPNSGTIRYFDRPGGSKGGNSIAHMVLTPSGTRFFGSMLSDATIFHWDLRESKPVGNLVGHKREVLHLALSPD